MKATLLSMLRNVSLYVDPNMAYLDFESDILTTMALRRCFSNINVCHRLFVFFVVVKCVQMVIIHTR